MAKSRTLRPLSPYTRFGPPARLRWMGTLAGVAALAVLAWHLGPLLTVGGIRPLEDALSRGAFAVASFVAWILFNRVADAQERRANARVLEALALRSDPDRRASADELIALRERAADAMKRLRTQRFGSRWGGRFAYQLPWYLMLGAPGAGKTTALEQAGLGSPLPGGQPVPAMGGTRTCDWWFTDHAVIIDTAGRYTTQDSRAAVDARVWTGLLDLIKEVRPRQPVNGVLLALSASDLAGWTDAERRAHATSLRERLGEMHRLLGVRVPIYVLCTKADLIEGFAGFFDSMSAQERAQVWGVTLPPEPADGAAPPTGSVAEGLRDGFNALLRRLDERLIERLHQEPDILRRSAAFAFPLRLASVMQRVQELVATIASPDRYADPPMLRGVYFTSALQDDGAAHRAARGTLTPAPGLSPAPAPAPSSFFLDHLMPGVIIPEANLAGTDRRQERRRRVRHTVALGGALAAAAAVLTFWAGSYAGNLALVERAAAAAAEASERIRPLDTPPRSLARVDDADFTAILPAMDALRALPAGWLERDRWPPLELTGGLYQGRRLGRPAEAVYRRALRSVFLSRVVLRLEERLRAGDAQPDPVAPALHAYRMMGGQEPLDRTFVAEWMAGDWLRTLPGSDNAARRRSLGDHLAALFDVGFASVPVDDALVERVQQGIARSGREPSGGRTAP